LFLALGAAAPRTQQLTRVKYTARQLLLSSEIIILRAGVVVRARARLPVRQRGFAHLADASAAPPVHVGGVPGRGALEDNDYCRTSNPDWGTA
jgi:hypothetical protein